MIKTRLMSRLLGWLLFSLATAVTAQNLRDPTVPPTEAGVSSTAHDSPASPGAVQGPMSVIVRNGQAFVIVSTRLYTQGQKLGQARIERISETEVWLREDGVLRKVPQFPGIQRRVVTGVAPSVVSQ